VADSAYPRLATLGDLPRLTLGTNVSGTWPPPGCTVVPVAHPDPWGLVVGDFEALPAGEWYVTTLANFVLSMPATAVSIMARAASTFVGPIALAVGVVGQWPVIFSPIEGRTMRWIKSTIRGTLGSVEQFQFGVNFGQPGDDPDLDAAGCAAFAASLAAKWDSVLVNTTFGTGGAAWHSQFPPDVKYTEVGVCINTQTDATAADGSGGNLAQEDPTEWAPINGITGRAGSGGASLPYEVSECVTLHTNKRGPSGRGRVYLPPHTTLAVSPGGGVFDSGYATAGGKALGKLFELVTADEGYVPVVVSRRRIVLNEVVQVSCGIVPDSQRRRRWAQLEAPIVAWNKP